VDRLVLESATIHYLLLFTTYFSVSADGGASPTKVQQAPPKPNPLVTRHLSISRDWRRGSRDHKAPPTSGECLGASPSLQLALTLFQWRGLLQLSVVTMSLRPYSPEYPTPSGKFNG